MGPDKLAEESIIALNIVRVKLLTRIAMLEHVVDNKERLRDDHERFTRAKDHVEAALTFIQQTHYSPGEVRLELPWSER